MIKLLPNIAPSKEVLEKLEEYQGEINKLPTFEERSAKAKKSFSGKNTTKNKSFNAVKEKLTEMCSGARRCVYCEDSVGDEVEHIRPKDTFPGFCFVWDNYVYACGNCNGPKNNKFAIFRDDGGAFYEANKDPGVEPPLGRDVLINPRIEDPMEFCMLDLRGTFKFVILKAQGTDEHKRADYTFNEVLRLNDQREFLRQARRLAYGNYKARLDSYAVRKAGGTAQHKLDKMIEEIKGEAHPTVWKEMQRYYALGFLSTFDPDLHDLFQQNPEALTW